jgi:rRNA small subunit pseudouridine methyltransferase Nep1
MPLIIILVESGLELVPDKLKSEKIARNNYDPNYFPSLILDNVIYHPVMKKLRNFEKRGRPDIVHQFLLNALGSPLNKEGLLELYIHTINDEIFKISPELRILRNYERFKGLMAKLLIDREIIHYNETLISEYKGTLKDLIKTVEPNCVLIFSSKGELVKDPISLFPKDPEKKIIALVGGFQKGIISDNLSAIISSDNLFSIYLKPLDSWVVVSRIITYYELALKI